MSDKTSKCQISSSPGDTRLHDVNGLESWKCLRQQEFNDLIRWFKTAEILTFVVLLFNQYREPLIFSADYDIYRYKESGMPDGPCSEIIRNKNMSSQRRGCLLWILYYTLNIDIWIKYFWKRNARKLVPKDIRFCLIWCQGYIKCARGRWLHHVPKW